MVEQSAVNRSVVGSSPTFGANRPILSTISASIRPTIPGAGPVGPCREVNPSFWHHSQRGPSLPVNTGAALLTCTNTGEGTLLLPSGLKIGGGADDWKIFACSFIAHPRPGWKVSRSAGRLASMPSTFWTHSSNESPGRRRHQQHSPDRPSHHANPAARQSGRQPDRPSVC
jgi:hypothetical protein